MSQSIIKCHSDANLRHFTCMRRLSTRSPCTIIPNSSLLEYCRAIPREPRHFLGFLGPDSTSSIAVLTVYLTNRRERPRGALFSSPTVYSCSILLIKYNEIYVFETESAELRASRLESALPVRIPHLCESFFALTRNRRHVDLLW